MFTWTIRTVAWTGCTASSILPQLQKLARVHWNFETDATGKYKLSKTFVSGIIPITAPNLYPYEVTQMSTKILPISDLRRQANEIINSVRETNDAVYITQHGRPVVVLVDYERYEQLQQDLEDLTDRLSLEAATTEPTRPYADFMAEMNLSDSATA